MGAARTGDADSRRRRPPLSRERIVAAAMRVADHDGLDGLSMRALARELGVEAMSIYHHLSGRSAVLDAMTDAVFARFHAPDPGAPWREELRARGHSMRAELRRHPWALVLVDTRSAPGEPTLRQHEAVVASLRAAGFPLELTAHAFALFDAYVYGAVAQELRVPVTDDAAAERLVDDLVGDGGTGLEPYPHLAELAVGVTMRPGYAFAREFDWGLEVVLDAIERRLAEAAAGDA